MKITIAIDSFKGSLTTVQAGEAVAEGIRRVYEDAKIRVFPMADGGEGTAEAIIKATGGRWKSLMVTGPFGRPIQSRYGLLEKTGTAVIEMAAASGLTLIGKEERNPLYTTTYGVGQMIADAIQEGCRDFIIGIGGSATNDGGIGMLQALGFEFLDGQGQPVSYGARGLEKLEKINVEKALPVLKECRFRSACDVKNPLCGPKGCSAVYGPQKGATPEMVEQMDLWLVHYAELTRSFYAEADPDAPGAGAAGGLGFAFMAYLHGTLCSGVELVMEQTGLKDEIESSDWIVTGEGRLDGQSSMGKAPVGVAKLAKEYGKPVIAFSGCVLPEARICNAHGIDAFFPILRTPCTLDEAMEPEKAARNLADTAEQVFRLIFLKGI